jgi:hypothetical protein
MSAAATLTPDASTTGSLPARRGFEVRGLVRIAVVGADAHDLAVVETQLGSPVTSLDGDPDITLRFVDRLPLDGPVRYVGLDAGYAGDRFLLLRGKHKSRVLVDLPVDALGGPCEITCERGLPAVPLLIAVINLTVLAKGGLPVHASAFRHDGRGVLVTGWAKGGKTEALLGFAARGAQYIGDEWIYLDGDRMRGIPEPIRMWDWHLQQVPQAWQALGRSQRARLHVLRGAAAAMTRVGARLPGVAALSRRFADLIDTQRYAHVPPARVFGPSPAPVDVPVDLVIFAATHASPEISVAPAAPWEVAARMAASLDEERAPLLSCYRRFRFAFPNRSNLLLDVAGEIERDRLRRFLHGKTCVIVHHPYPPSIPALCAALRPVVERQDAAWSANPV